MLAAKQKSYNSTVGRFGIVLWLVGQAPEARSEGAPAGAAKKPLRKPWERQFADKGTAAALLAAAVG